jgi:HK97 family phage major capsid protein
MKKIEEQIKKVIAESFSKKPENTTEIRLSQDILDKNIKKLSSDNETEKKEVIASFMKDLNFARMGVNSANKKEAPIQDISLMEGVNAYFGLTTKEFLSKLGINTEKQSLSELANLLGGMELSSSVIEKNLRDYSSLDAASFANTQNIDTNYRFLIPEIILTAINIGYEASSLHLKWIRGTQNISKKKVTAPQILEGDTMPSRISEGGAIPFGSLKFGQKEVQVFKIGVGFDMTDELIDQSSIDLMNVFLAQVGVKMSIGADFEALRVLISGEQANGTESCPVIGVLNTANGFTHYDIDNVKMQMQMLKQPASNLLARKSELIVDLNENKPQRERETVIDYCDLQTDMWAMPNGQIMFINADNAMMKLQYKRLMVEPDRDVKHQTNQIYVTNHIGFMNIKRDARVILDRTVSLSTNPIPSFMDIEAYLNQSFKN